MKRRVRKNEMGATKLAREKDGIVYTGKPNCPKCGGRGIVNVPNSPIMKVRPCECTIIQELLANLERGWKGLRYAQNLSSPSPLLDIAKSEEDCWITAENDVLRSHMKHVALRMPPHWHFSVQSDADLLSAWLASVPLSGMRVLDPEIAMRLSEHAPVSMNKLTLVDLVQPPDLLVVVLGVKAARNSALTEVLHETITLRVHQGLPIWIVDQPSKPFGESHRAWSMGTRSEMHDFSRISLDGLVRHQDQPTRKNTANPTPKRSLPSVNDLMDNAQNGSNRNRLRFSNGSGGTQRTNVDLPQPKPQKKYPKKKGWKQ